MRLSGFLLILKLIGSIDTIDAAHLLAMPRARLHIGGRGIDLLHQLLRRLNSTTGFSDGVAHLLVVAKHLDLTTSRIRLGGQAFDDIVGGIAVARKDDANMLLVALLLVGIIAIEDNDHAPGCAAIAVLKLAQQQSTRIGKRLELSRAKHQIIFDNIVAIDQDITIRSIPIIPHASILEQMLEHMPETRYLGTNVDMQE